MDSPTTGWNKRDEGGYEKIIGGYLYTLTPHKDGWAVEKRDWMFPVHKKLADAKREAHIRAEGDY